DMKVYPNPANLSSEINLDVPEAMVGGKAVLYDANGAKIKTFDVTKRTETISTTNLKAGNYFVELNKESISMKRQLIVVQ
ncbi:MAG: T9SS type A sorting domain-containing protein, partial [Bacteroidota bacterium]